MEQEEKICKVDETLKKILIEWRILSLSKEKLIDKINNIYDGGENNEIKNRKPV